MGWYWFVSSPTPWNHGVSPNRKTISGAPITYGQNIEPHGLSWFPPFGPAVRCRLPRHLRCREDRIGSLASRSDVRRSWDRGVGAVNFLGDKPSQGSARIPPDPQQQQSKI